MYGPLKADCAVESTNIGLHPNPCETEVTISIASEKPTNLNYTLISSEGKVLETKQFGVQSGMTLFNLDVSDYQSGMYLLQFEVNDKRFIKKLTVQ
jgi:DNA polymerase III alpha subunit (gram-positive type)